MDAKAFFADAEVVVSSVEEVLRLQCRLLGSGVTSGISGGKHFDKWSCLMSQQVVLQCTKKCFCCRRAKHLYQSLCSCLNADFSELPA